MTTIKQTFRQASGHKRFTPANLFKWLLILFFAFYTLFPLLWLIVSSFKTNTELFGNPFALPEVFLPVYHT